MQEQQRPPDARRRRTAQRTAQQYPRWWRLCSWGLLGGGSGGSGGGGVVVAAESSAPPRFGVAVTLAHNASVAPRQVQQQLCRLRGVVLSLRRVGFAGDIVCQTAGGWTEIVSVRNTLSALCDRVLILSVPNFDAGPATADTNATIAYYRRRGLVPRHDPRTV